MAYCHGIRFYDAENNKSTFHLEKRVMMSSYASSRLGRLKVRGIAVLAALAAASLTGCIAPTAYVDSKLGDVAMESLAKPKSAKPVQLLFEFQSKGATNTRATDLLKPEITDLVKQSGLFSDVETTAVENGSILNIVINNVPPEDAASKGFATGLTFGAVGTTVADNYVSTANFVSGKGAAPMTKEEHHTIVTTIGNTDAPPNAVKAESILEAVKTMTRQSVSHLLKDISEDPSFGK